MSQSYNKMPQISKRLGHASPPAPPPPENWFKTSQAAFRPPKLALIRKLCYV